MPQRRRATQASGASMRAGADTATGRVIALIVLVLAAGAATRG
ncbi:DUF4129 domain-containing protein, partial [Mycolicibacter senuensis]